MNYLINHAEILLYAGIPLFIIGIVLLYLSRKKDEDNWIVQKATPLALQSVWGSGVGVGVT